MNNVFITWHFCQRSRSLADRLTIPILEISPEGRSFYRFSYCSAWTIYILVKFRPRVIVVQNSFLLLFILAVYKLIRTKPTTIICDCHTKALRRRAAGVFGDLFWRTKVWSFSKTNLCLVHNKEQTPDVAILSKNYLILPDPLPRFPEASIVENYKNAAEKDRCVFGLFSKICGSFPAQVMVPLYEIRRF